MDVQKGTVTAATCVLPDLLGIDAHVLKDQPSNPSIQRPAREVRMKSWIFIVSILSLKITEKYLTLLPKCGSKFFENRPVTLQLCASWPGSGSEANIGFTLTRTFFVYNVNGYILYAFNPFTPRGEGVLINIWVGVCRPVLKILTLFQTNIYDVPLPISDLTLKMHSLFQTLWCVAISKLSIGFMAYGALWRPKRCSVFLSEETRYC